MFDAAGIADVPILTRHFNDRACAADAARELLETHPEITAVLCTTDSMALGVLDYCGGRVPHAVSVTGFDGIDTARAAGLTTVEQPNVEKGEKVGSLLSSLIDAAAAPQDIILSTRFVPGRTVAAPRRDG